MITLFIIQTKLLINIMCGPKLISIQHQYDCPLVIIENYTTECINNIDYSNMLNIHKGCNKRNFPCAKIFIKYGQRKYHIKCGYPNE